MKTPLGTEVDLGPGHIVLDGVPAVRERGTAAPPVYGPCLLWPRSHISAPAELLLLYRFHSTEQCFRVRAPNLGNVGLLVLRDRMLDSFPRTHLRC